MSANTDKASNDKVNKSEMEDGGRCLLDVINDPQLLQSFLNNSSNSSKNDPSSISVAQNIKNEVKAKKSVVVATKSLPPPASAPTVNELKLTTTTTLAVKKVATTTTKNETVNINTLQSGLIMDNSQAIGVSPASAVGIIPISSLPQSQPIAIPSTNTSMRAQSPMFPNTQIQLGPRQMTVLPQQLIMPGMQVAPNNGIPQIVFASRASTPGQTIQPMIQIIQTSQGPQIVQQNSQPASIQQIITSTPSKVSMNSNSRLNKQILPKPLSSFSSAVVASTPQSNNTKVSTSQAGIKVMTTTSIHPTASTFGTPLSTNASLTNSPQLLLGPGGQHTGIITTPQGSFVLNNINIPGLGQQQILLPAGNVQNSPVQIIRPQGPVFVNNNTLSTDSSNLSFAFNSSATSKPQPTQSPQTFVLSNQNTPVSTANGLVMAPRPTTPQSIFIRPFGAPPQPIQSTPQPQQFIQVQTANGPVLVAVNSAPAPQILNPQSSVQPSIQIGNVISLATTPSAVNLQSATNNIQTILAQPQQPPNNNNNNTSITNQPTAAAATATATPLKSSTVEQTPKAGKGLNLADLLKEFGISDFGNPPTSPKNSSTPSQPDPNQTVLMVGPGGGATATAAGNVANQATNLPSNTTTTQQLRISVAPDGTIVLLSPNSALMNPVQKASKFADPSGMGSSQPSPDSTTPSIETSSPLTVGQQSDEKEKSELTNCTYKTVDCIDTKSNSTSDFGAEKLCPPRPPPPPTLTSSVFIPKSVSQDSFPRSTPDAATPKTITTNVVVPLLTSQVVSQSTDRPPLDTQPPPPPNLLFKHDNSQPLYGIRLFDQKGMFLEQLDLTSKDFLITLEAQLKHLLSIKELVAQQKEWLNELLSLKQKFALLETNLVLIQMNISPLTEQLLKLSKLNAQKNNSSLNSSQLENVVSDNLIFNNSVIKLKTCTVATGSAIQDTEIKTENFVQPLSKEESEAKAAEQKILDEQAKKKAEADKKKFEVFKAIQQQLHADQNSALNPNCRTPFKSRDDACKRLLRYHVFDTPTFSQNDIEKFDELYENIAQILLNKKNLLFNKYRYLLLRQGMKDSLSCEHVMLGRMFLEEEASLLKVEKEHQHEQVSAGNNLDMSSFSPTPVDSVKRKLPDEEINQYSEYLPFKEMKSEPSPMFDNEKFDEPQLEPNKMFNSLSDLEKDDNVLNSVDELIQQLNSPAVSQQQSELNSSHPVDSFIDNLDNVPLQDNYNDPLDPNSLKNVSDDLDALCSKIKSEDHQLDQSILSLTWDSNITTNSSSSSSLSHTTRSNNEEINSSWNAGFGVTEAEAAVQSIMKNETESLPVDLAGIEDLDNLNENSFFIDSLSATQNEMDQSLKVDTTTQQELDVQMNCAIKSIMMSSPNDQLNQMSSAPQTGYNANNQSYNHINTSISNTSYNFSYHHHHSTQQMSGHLRPNNLMAYSSSVANDQLLDEAVKSILS